MICGNCSFSSSVPGTGMLKCALTEEIRFAADECNCEDRRVMKYREVEVATNRENTLKDLSDLRDRLLGNNGSARPDIRYVYDTLQEIALETPSDKLAELVKYMEAFL
jgi:hypothetical protein